MYYIKLTQWQETFINAWILSKYIHDIAGTKICRKLNRRKQIWRQSTAFADKKEYFDGTISSVMVYELIYKMTVFPLISTIGLYLISNLVDAVLIKGKRLKEGSAYFKVRKIYHINIQNFVFVSFSNKNETQNLNRKKI